MHFSKVKDWTVSMFALNASSPLAKAKTRGTYCKLFYPQPAVANLIRENRTHQLKTTMQTGAALGMQTLDASLQDLVVRGLVTVEEARRHAEDPRAIGGAGFAPPPPTVP